MHSRALVTNPESHAGAFVVVGLEREGEDMSRIVETLEPLGIPADVVARGHQFRRVPSVVIRVPPERVTDAIVALELKGFVDVLAYQWDEGPM